MLCNYIHCYLAQIQIRCNSCSSRYSCRIIHILNNFCGKLSCRHIIQLHIICCINKYFINTVYSYVVLAEIFKIYRIYLRRIFYIKSHSWNCYSIFKLLSCAFFNFFCLLFYLKKPASSGKSIFLKRRSNCKTYCFGCSRFISYNEISGKRV